MRMIIIAAAALLVLGGGAAGAYFYFSQNAEAAVGPDGQPIEITEKDDKHQKGGHGEANSSKFVELTPIILPIVDGNGVSQTISMIVTIEVANSGKAGEIEKMMPKLTDAYIQDLYGALSRHAALKGGSLQLDILKERLNKITHNIMGKEDIHGVLLQAVEQRPI